MIRRACNWTQKEIAHDMNITLKTVQKYLYEFENKSHQYSPEEIVSRQLSEVTKVVIE